MTGEMQVEERGPVPRTPSFRLDGRKALVTGAGRGIGFACAAALAEAGAAVTLISRSAGEIEAAAEALRSQGGDARAAVLAELMLRGPQTPGEIRQRSTRMVDFPDLEVLEEILEGMTTGAEPIVVKLPRQPGKREARYAHTLCGEVQIEDEPADLAPVPRSSLEKRVEQLEATLAEVLERLERLES